MCIALPPQIKIVAEILLPNTMFRLNTVVEFNMADKKKLMSITAISVSVIETIDYYRFEEWT